ncbi:MAG: prenyltransferase [Candidatus Heimdallarchaeota archaeon]|nr:prenyltransferase [Candidatus Heimdallarchaeota archaeon]
MTIHETETLKKPDIKFLDKLKGYIDLTRAHFAIVWPLLFCSGLMLAFRNYGGFDWWLLVRVALIGLFGFEAGMVLNDIIDRKIDQIEPDDTMTKYWRPFKERPIPSGIVSLKEAVTILIIFLVITIALIATLPFPNFLYVYGIMIYAYSAEYFYHTKKRNQKFPFAQLIGRTDLTVFPLAGYLSFGKPDLTILLFAVFFYPWALAHLGTNDIGDVENDQAKNLNTVTVLYGLDGNVIWIALFTFLHIAAVPIFLIFGGFGLVAIICFSIATVLLLIANILLILKRTAKRGRKVLPMLHASLFLYTTSIIIDSALVF